MGAYLFLYRIGKINVKDAVVLEKIDNHNATVDVFKNSLKISFKVFTGIIELILTFSIS